MPFTLKHCVYIGKSVVFGHAVVIDIATPYPVESSLCFEPSVYEVMMLSLGFAGTMLRSAMLNGCNS